MAKLIAILVLSLLTGCGGSETNNKIVSFYGDSVTTGYYGDSGTDRLLPPPVQYMQQIGCFTALDYSKNGALAKDFNIVKDNSTSVVFRYGLADIVTGSSIQEYTIAVENSILATKRLNKEMYIVGISKSTVDTNMYNTSLKILASKYGIPFIDVSSLPDNAYGLVDSIHPNLSYSQSMSTLIVDILCNRK